MGDKFLILGSFYSIILLLLVAFPPVVAYQQLKSTAAQQKNLIQESNQSLTKLAFFKNILQLHPVLILLTILLLALGVLAFGFMVFLLALAIWGFHGIYIDANQFRMTP